MILSDKSIRQAIVDDRIEVSPDITHEQIQPASLDVRLGNEFFDAETGKRWESDALRLEPGERYLAHTKETVSLPNDIAAQLAGRSTIGRRGIIVHMTAGWCDPGFEGDIVFEMMNLGKEDEWLSEGERVAQLVFMQLDTPSEGYDGSYQGQEGATEARP